jgi:hypothetical protein
MLFRTVYCLALLQVLRSLEGHISFAAPLPSQAAAFCAATRALCHTSLLCLDHLKPHNPEAASLALPVAHWAALVTGRIVDTHASVAAGWAPAPQPSSPSGLMLALLPEAVESLHVVLSWLGCTPVGRAPAFRAGSAEATPHPLVTHAGEVGGALALANQLVRFAAKSEAAFRLIAAAGGVPCGDPEVRALNAVNMSICLLRCLKQDPALQAAGAATHMPALKSLVVAAVKLVRGICQVRGAGFLGPRCYGAASNLLHLATEVSGTVLGQCSASAGGLTHRLRCVPCCLAHALLLANQFMRVVPAAGQGSA